MPSRYALRTFLINQRSDPHLLHAPFYWYSTNGGFYLSSSRLQSWILCEFEKKKDKEGERERDKGRRRATESLSTSYGYNVIKCDSFPLILFHFPKAITLIIRMAQRHIRRCWSTAREDGRDHSEQMIDHRTRDITETRACIARHISPHSRYIRNTTARHFLHHRA